MFTTVCVAQGICTRFALSVSREEVATADYDAYVVGVQPLGSRSDGDTVFLAHKVSGGPKFIKLSWEGSTLVIDYPITSHIFQQEYTANVRGKELFVRYRLN